MTIECLESIIFICNEPVKAFTCVFKMSSAHTCFKGIHSFHKSINITLLQDGAGKDFLLISKELQLLLMLNKVNLFISVALSYVLKCWK